MKVRNMIIAALFAGLTCIGAFIKIDIAYIPFTFQFFFCALSGVLLGARLGALSQIVYVAIGLLGIPVFSQGGGVQYVLKPSFGYIIGFIAAAYIIGLLCDKSESRLGTAKLFLIQLAGLFALYLAGVVYMFFIMNFYIGKPMAILNVIKIGVLPFILADLVKIALVSFIGVKIRPVIQKLYN